MQVKLKVLRGKSAGKQVKVPSTSFVIGRGQECHMRPKSDSISRRHCEITVEADVVTVQDLGSKNGTLVNGDRIESPTTLKNGDELRVGRLEFRVLIDSQVSARRPKKQVAVGGEGESLEDNAISDWLEEGDESDQARRLAEPDTRQFRLDDTERVDVEGDENTEEKTDTEIVEVTEVLEKEDGKKKQRFGKLPTQQHANSADSREAASDMLKKFFNRR